MNRNLLATCILSLTFTCVGYAQGMASSPENGAHYTKAQLKQLVQNAHTPEQYTALASYFNEQKSNYLQQAAEEKREWESRGQNVMGMAAKYPRPVDSARNLYEYYIYKASKAEILEAKYSRVASQNAPVNAQ